MIYCTVYQARDHLRLEDDESLELPAKIAQASAMVANYLGADAPAGLDTADPGDEYGPDDYAPPAIPAVVQAATLLMLGYLYRYRDEDPGYVHGYLPTPVISILYPLRSPSCA